MSTSQSNARTNESEEHVQHWQQWNVVGEAQLSVLFFDIYTSTLRSPDGKYLSSSDVSPHPLALAIEYQRDISRQQLLDATIEQWRHLGFNAQDIEPWSRVMGNIFPNVEVGQQLAYVTNGRSGQFYYAKRDQNAEPIGYINDEQLNDAFLAIWLSPDTEYPALRRKLIGEK